MIRNTWKRIYRAALLLPTKLLILLIPVTCGLLALAFLFFGAKSPLSIVAYSVSFVTLSLYCMRIPLFIRFLREIKENDARFKRFLSSPETRIRVTLTMTFFFNTAYVVFQIALGLYHRSFWFHSLAIYYALLAVMRFFLIYDIKTDREGKRLRLEYFYYLFCGIALLVLNVVLVGIVLSIQWFGRGFSYGPIVTITMAVYTFISLILAIKNAIKYHNARPAFAAAKNISLVTACVSILALETAMLNAFGRQGTAAQQALLTGMTGGIVCTLSLVLSSYMIIHAIKELRALRVASESHAPQSIEI